MDLCNGKGAHFTGFPVPPSAQHLLDVKIDALFPVVINFSLLYILSLGSLEIICLYKSR